MTTSMLRRQLKNLVQNYSEAEVKVREATSNDPWGPSSSQMADISDLTYNAVACNEIMTMLWKRLKDDRNWRHILKSLTLLEYILKTGDDRVLLKMKDNIYIVKALTEYRFVEKDGKDQGGTVREKAKVVLVLMEDDEKLKEEREFAVKTREKTSKGSAGSSTDNVKDPNYKPCYVAGASGLPSLSNIPSVADLTASFEARKEERIRQETEKKETERRAKLSEDELQWEDAGKGTDTKVNAWGGEEKQEEEEKSDAWGAPKEPSSGPWGDPAKTEDAFAAAKTDEDPFSAPKNGEDPFAAPKNGEDPFAAPKNGEDPFVAPKNGEDPFGAPKDKPDPFTASKDDPFSTPKDVTDPFSAPKNKDDPFAAPKDKPDPFSSSNNDPFNAPKDDPFNAPKDDPFNAPKDDPFNAPKDDPFNAPKDDPFNAPKDDPFNAPKDDPFNAPKDDPFNAPKDDPFNAPKDDPFNAPKDDPFNAPKDDPFNAPKDDPFNAPKDDPFNAPQDDPFNAPQDDPFGAPKDDKLSAPKNDPFNAPQNDAFTTSSEDPFNAPKDDPFTAPTSAAPKEEPTLSKDDPFTAPTTPPKDLVSTPNKPVQDDPFASPPTTPPGEDPFTATSKPTKDDPFDAPSTPPKEDPFAVPASPPYDNASDPFNAPAEALPQDGADAWGLPSATKETKSGDAWGASSPVDNSDPFGDSSKPDDDPWGAPASAPISADDAWGAPAAPSDSSPSGDPFGDGASKSNDPWGAPSNASGSGAGKQTVQEGEIYRKAATFLGSAGASLVDLDDLFSSNPKPGQRPLINTLSAQTQAIGKFSAKDIAAAPMARSGALAETSAYYSNHFGSSRAISPAFGAVNPTGEAPLFQQPSYALGVSHSAAGVLQAAPEMRMMQPVSVVGNPPMGLGMAPSGYHGSNPFGTGNALSSFIGGNNPTGAGIFRSSTPQTTGGGLLGSGLEETINKNNNPFLF